MAKEAEAHAGEDKEKREEIEARNQLDSLVYQVDKMFRENGDKVSGEERGTVETALADAKSTLSGSPNATELKAAHDKLQQASYKLAEAMYKTGAAPTDGDAAAAGTTDEAHAEAKKDEGVIDAEYVDVK